MSGLRQVMLFAALCLCALGAPVRLRLLNYAESRMLSIKLNEQARLLHDEQKNISNEVATVTNPPLMIRPEDECNPESLRENPETCLSRVVLALKNYTQIFGDNGLFQGQNNKCKKWRTNASALAKLMEEFLHILKEPTHHPAPLMINEWMIEGYLCQDSIERLYSFSIITARVFNYLHFVQ